MLQEFENVTFLVGTKEILSQMENVPVLPVFSEKITDFLCDLSDELLHDVKAKKYGDIIAYAFWIRKASIDNAYKKYENEKYRLGRGIAFQIAPANIPVQFAVSMTYALIAGNVSVVRVSRKQYEQVDIICNAIKRVLIEKNPECIPYICVLRYEYSEQITSKLSEKCDVRMIWGGDNTIKLMRKIPTKPRCLELSFADRYSFAIIDADEYLRKYSDTLTNDFYLDTYYTDQNACSSTRLIVWTGTQIESAKELFWKSLIDKVQKDYELSDISGSEKLLRTALCAAEYPKIRQVRINNSIVRIEIPQLYEDIMKYKGNCGYFFEYETEDLESIIPLLSQECQTITYLGENVRKKIREMVWQFGVKGVDRIVPMGHSMDLSFVWDGYDLPITLSRVVADI